MVEFSPATREARVQFPANARLSFSFFLLLSFEIPGFTSSFFSSLFSLTNHALKHLFSFRSQVGEPSCECALDLVDLFAALRMGPGPVRIRHSSHDFGPPHF